MKKKSKKQKRKRLEPLARIRRRLMRLWTARVGDEWGHKCAVCGSESTPNAHHLENRNTCRALRYDPMNGVLLCPSHHKFGKDSAHKGGIWFADWLRRNHPGQLEYVLAHRNDDINLNDRETLARIEAYLSTLAPAPITLAQVLILARKLPPVAEPVVQEQPQTKEANANESNPADNG